MTPCRRTTQQLEQPVSVATGSPVLPPQQKHEAVAALLVGELEARLPRVSRGPSVAQQQQQQHMRMEQQGQGLAACFPSVAGGHSSGSAAAAPQLAAQNNRATQQPLGSSHSQDAAAAAAAAGGGAFVSGHSSNFDLDVLGLGPCVGRSSCKKSLSLAGLLTSASASAPAAAATQLKRPAASLEQQWQLVTGRQDSESQDMAAATPGASLQAAPTACKKSRRTLQQEAPATAAGPLPAFKQQHDSAIAAAAAATASTIGFQRMFSSGTAEPFAGATPPAAATAAPPALAAAPQDPASATAVTSLPGWQPLPAASSADDLDDSPDDPEQHVQLADGLARVTTELEALVGE